MGCKGVLGTVVFAGRRSKEATGLHQQVRSLVLTWRRGLEMQAVPPGAVCSGYGGLVVTKDELGVLDRFDTDGRLALSLYLDVSTPERRATVLDRIRSEIRTVVPEGPQLDSLAEDLEMVRLFFSTSATRQVRYVAIFSCAAQLFWRAYPCDQTVDELIIVDSSFHTAPLRRLLETRSGPQPVLVEERDLLPQP